MKELLRQSKKFRAGVITALVGLLFPLAQAIGMPISEEVVTQIVDWIFMLGIAYIGAEGVSEMKAKAVIEENKARKDLSDKVLDKLVKVEEEK